MHRATMNQRSGDSFDLAFQRRQRIADSRRTLETAIVDRPHLDRHRAQAHLAPSHDLGRSCCGRLESSCWSFRKFQSRSSCRMRSLRAVVGVEPQVASRASPGDNSSLPPTVRGDSFSVGFGCGIRRLRSRVGRFRRCIRRFRLCCWLGSRLRCFRGRSTRPARSRSHLPVQWRSHLPVRLVSAPSMAFRSSTPRHPRVPSHPGRGRRVHRVRRRPVG